MILKYRCFFCIIPSTLNVIKTIINIEGARSPGSKKRVELSLLGTIYNH